MKKMFCLVILVFVTGCAGMFGGTIIPAPRAGLVGIANPNQGAYAQCRLDSGYWSQQDLFAVDPNGQYQWDKPAMRKFEVRSSSCEEVHNTKFLSLAPHSPYTLSVIWTRFDGRILSLNMYVRTFSTSDELCREPYTDRYGQTTCMDKFIKLPYVDSRGVTSFSFHRTIDAANWIRALVGLP